MQKGKNVHEHSVCQIYKAAQTLFCFQIILKRCQFVCTCMSPISIAIFGHGWMHKLLYSVNLIIQLFKKYIV